VNLGQKDPFLTAGAKSGRHPRSNLALRTILEPQEKAMHGMNQVSAGAGNPTTGQREQIIAWTGMNGQETLRNAWRSSKRDADVVITEKPSKPRQRREK
jgi:hypothetical protein